MARLFSVVLACLLDETRERQVTRRDAASWCSANALPYFETHAKDASGWTRMLAHLASACLGLGTAPELGASGFAGQPGASVVNEAWLAQMRRGRSRQGARDGGGT